MPRRPWTPGTRVARERNRGSSHAQNAGRSDHSPWCERDRSAGVTRPRHGARGRRKLPRRAHVAVRKLSPHGVDRRSAHRGFGHDARAPARTHVDPRSRKGDGLAAPPGVAGNPCPTPDGPGRGTARHWMARPGARKLVAATTPRRGGAMPPFSMATPGCRRRTCAARASAPQRTSSAMTRMASGWLVAQMRVVTPAALQSDRRSRMRSGGPHNATSSTSASGTAASASARRPDK